MRQQQARSLFLTIFVLVVGLIPWLAGCSICQPVRGMLVEPMAHEPLYELRAGSCVQVTDPDRAGSGPFFADAGCTQEATYRSTPFRRFCGDNLKDNRHTKEYVGNPEAWRPRERDPADPQHETTWSLSQGSRLHIAAVNQTEHCSRPYLKRVAYRQVNSCSLAMHVYKRSLDATGLKPAIFIYGGGWSHRGALAIASMETLAPNLTEQGYIVFAPFHRILQGSKDGPEKCRNATGEEIVADIEAALDWVLAHGDRYGMDPAYKTNGPVVVVGQSSGAHLAGYLAVNHRDRVERALLLYPPTDLPFLTSGLLPGGIYEGSFANAEELLLRFANVQQLEDIDLDDPFFKSNGYPQEIDPDPAGFPRFFVVHGDADQTVPVEQSTRLCEALDPSRHPSDGLYPGGDLVTDCGPGNRLHVIRGADHALDLRCFSGAFTKLVRRLFDADLCPSGYSGSTKVREALEEAYGDL